MSESEYKDQLVSDTNTLLSTLKSQGKTQISTESLVVQLVKMGHNVNIHSIIPVLELCPFADAYTPTSITLTSVEDTDEVSDKTDSEEHVERMAQKQADRAIK